MNRVLCVYPPWIQEIQVPRDVHLLLVCLVLLMIQAVQEYLRILCGEKERR